MSVRLSLSLSLSLSLYVEKLGCNWKDFHYVWYLRTFRESVVKTQVLLKGDKNKKDFHDDLKIFVTFR